MKYQVLWSGLPAKNNWNKNPNWKTNIFNSFALANEYANYWTNSLETQGSFIQFVLNEPYDVNGWGDTVVIKEYYTDLEKELAEGDRYWLGPIVKVHRIEDFQFIEYQQLDFNFIPEKKTGKTCFSIFLNEHSIGHSAETIDQALITAIGYKYDGGNSRAADYFFRIVGNEVHKDAIDKVLYK